MTTCPDLRPFFKHAISRPMPHSFGVPVLSDWSDKRADDPVFGVFTQCGFWTVSEAAILYETARQLKGDWLDIGGHTGWTAAHLLAAECYVEMLDPMYENGWFAERAKENLRLIEGGGSENYILLPFTSDEWFRGLTRPQYAHIMYAGVVIDGNHERPHPLHDAQNAAKHLRTPGCILLHDAIGAPVQEAVEWLIEVGFSAKVYLTPHVVACCWRGEFIPPEYEPEERVKRALEARLPGWMLECSSA